MYSRSSRSYEYISGLRGKEGSTSSSNNYS